MFHWAHILNTGLAVSLAGVRFTHATDQTAAPSAEFNPNIRCQDEMRITYLDNSMQHRCAKAVYGGRTPNAEAYGFYSPMHSNIFANRAWPIRFDADRLDSPFSNPHLLFWCLQRCWSHIPAKSEVPEHQKYTVVSRQLKDTLIIKSGGSRAEWYNKVPIPPGKGSTLVPAIELIQAPQVMHWWQSAKTSIRSHFISLHPDNRILCVDEDKAPLPAPEPWSSQYTTLQEMCATALDGGNPDKNMGGVCWPRRGAFTPYIFFDPTLTPSLHMVPKNFDMVGQNAAIRAAQLHCFYYCSCASEPELDREKQRTRQSRKVPWMDGSSVAPDSGGMRIISRADGYVVDVLLKAVSLDQAFGRQCSGGVCLPVEDKLLAKVLRLPDGSSNIDYSTPCEADGRCPAVYGDEYAERVEPLVSKCRGRCAGPRGCSAQCPLCSVGRPRLESVGSKGNQIFSFDDSRCISLVRMQSGALFPRDQEAPCVCNSTYVSMACCEAGDDGMVWEMPGLKLGHLDFGVENMYS